MHQVIGGGLGLPVAVDGGNCRGGIRQARVDCYVNRPARKQCRGVILSQGISRRRHDRRRRALEGGVIFLRQPYFDHIANERVIDVLSASPGIRPVLVVGTCHRGAVGQHFQFVIIARSPDAHRRVSGHGGRHWKSEAHVAAPGNARGRNSIHVACGIPEAAPSGCGKSHRDSRSRQLPGAATRQRVPGHSGGVGC